MFEGKSPPRRGIRGYLNIKSISPTFPTDPKLLITFQLSSYSIKRIIQNSLISYRIILF
jgi:hypothetical protein